jgi:hypothetical protein
MSNEPCLLLDSLGSKVAKHRTSQYQNYIAQVSTIAAMDNGTKITYQDTLSVLPLSLLYTMYLHKITHQYCFWS